MVLALKASKIATHSSNGKRARSRKEVEDRLFFNRVHIQGDRTTEDEGVKLSLSVLSHATDATLGR
jgi:hypothetical protein